MLNSSLNLAQFWDGRAADLKAQAGGPIANPGEMAFTHTLALGVVEAYKGNKQGVEGRSAVSGKDIDRFNFKVPTLRNVEMT